VFNVNISVYYLSVTNNQKGTLRKCGYLKSFEHLISNYLYLIIATETISA